MNPTPFRTIIVTLCLSAAAISLATVWFGWFGGNDLLVRYSPNFQAIVPTTALCFLVLTVALFGIGNGKDGGNRLAIWCARFVFGLVGLNMLVRLLAHQDGLDALLPFWTDLGDRMSYATAALLILSAFLVRRTATTLNNPPLLLVGGALTGLTTTGSIAMSHALDVNSPYRLGICDGISAYSLLLFGLVFSALLLIHLTAPGGAGLFDEDY
ncbi:hypothetical protein ILP92_00815 [Maribius pontilimi]|uniref:Uncharacterized protein n=1 Tax=Palleronia pontilimi TaxID=1964209 RepID=A0A934IDP5_9RHOB|nr:hypothetical protein [Palleronia pontilimi]MBJ3761292.1 hypothetical protein [Palleronia pontilimi]